MAGCPPWTNPYAYETNCNQRCQQNFSYTWMTDILSVWYIRSISLSCSPFEAIVIMSIGKYCFSNFALLADQPWIVKSASHNQLSVTICVVFVQFGNFTTFGFWPIRAFSLPIICQFLLAYINYAYILLKIGGSLVQQFQWTVEVEGAFQKQMECLWDKIMFIFSSAWLGRQSHGTLQEITLLPSGTWLISSHLISSHLHLFSAVSRNMKGLRDIP